MDCTPHTSCTPCTPHTPCTSFTPHTSCTPYIYYTSWTLILLVPLKPLKPLAPLTPLVPLSSLGPLTRGLSSRSFCPHHLGVSEGWRGVRGVRAISARFLDPNHPVMQKVETTLITACSVEVSPPPASRTTTHVYSQRRKWLSYVTTMGQKIWDKKTKQKDQTNH